MASFYRIIDSSANRACEALRVVEDFVRFLCDDAALTEELKGMRHQLTAAMRHFSMAERLNARDTEADVGTQIQTPSEYTRSDVSDVLAANFSRLQESLRSLEEFSKIESPETAAKFEQLRYQSYTLQKRIFQATHSSEAAP